MTQVILNGLFVGSFYALIALGYSMVYGIIKLLNFAHGDIFMFGAYIGMTCLVAIPGIGSLGIGALAVILLVSIVLTGTTGVLIEALAYRPLRTAPRLSVLITAVGMSFFLEYGVRQIWGPDPQPWPSNGRLSDFLSTTDATGAKQQLSVPIFDGALTYSQLVILAFAVVLMAALALYIGKTREGRAMRAIALDQRAASLMGVNVNATISRVFFIGSAMAGVAGVMHGAYYSSITFLMGFLLGLKAFTAAVIGGIGNLYGAMLGGLTLGLLESIGTTLLGGEWKDVFAFVFLILFLTVKPTGILGERVVERM
ncbi:MAG: branched-chain amino acid ABC transporter permease [Propionibacteriaceae bacterium]|jgi:branched-chain amino acid transport system permease protein|nr:branched-chain amino acid ABC transporter permease [Propionibacteriaceae bacterium]